MSVSIQALLQTVTADEVVAAWVTGLEALGVPASKWRKGGVASTMLRILAITYALFSGTMVAALSGQFLDYASGSWLILLARYVYGVDAIEATFANGTLTIENSGGGIYDYDPGEFVVLNPTTKVQYSNAETLHIGALSTLADVPFEALIAGTGGNANPGDVDELVTTALGVTVTNPGSFVGTDAETDPDLRQRCRDKLGSLSVRGPRNAYEWAAKSAVRPDGNPVNINRVSISTSSSTGKVVVTIASPAGTVDPTDLQAVIDNIEAKVRPQTVTVIVNAATATPYSTTMTVWALATPGLDQATVIAAVQTALTAYIAQYRIGGIAKPPSAQGYLWASGIEGIVKGAHPSIFAVDGVTADLALAVGAVATDAEADNQISVRLVAPS
jgi:phage-related baseplate assembly protein